MNKRTLAAAIRNLHFDSGTIRRWETAKRALQLSNGGVNDHDQETTDTATTRVSAAGLSLIQPDNGRRIVFLYTTGGGTGQMVNNLRYSGLFDQFPAEFIETHQPGGVALRARIFVRALWRYATLLLMDRVELVHAHMSYGGSFWRKALCIALAKACRVPVVLHLHGSQLKDYVEASGPLHRRLIRALLDSCDTVIVLSRQWQEYISLVAPTAQVAIVHNFVDADGIQAAVQRLGLPRARHTMLFLGEIGARKGIFELVAALAKVAAVVPDVRLVAAGGGQLEEVRRLAEKLGVSDRVVLPGWVSGEGKIRLLAEASLYVLPSHNEGLPVSILEAMACGLPVISTPVGGIPEAIRPGCEGYLVPPGDVDALAAQLIATLSDDQLLKRLGDQARLAIAERFSAASAVNRIAALYVKSGVHPREVAAA